MEAPTKLAIGQVWRLKYSGDFVVIHKSTTGKKFRALNLSSFIANERNSDEPPSWWTFVCALDGDSLINKEET